MKLNTITSRSLGELVKDVKVLGAVVESALTSTQITVTPVTSKFGTSAKVANAGGAKIHCVLKLMAGKEVVPYDGEIAVSIVNSASGKTKPLTKAISKNGYIEFDVEYLKTWAETDTCTITVGTSDKIYGHSIKTGEIVDTFVA